MALTYIEIGASAGGSSGTSDFDDLDNNPFIGVAPSAGIAGIQAAVTALDSAGHGGLIQLQPGTYSGTARLTIPTSVNGVSIRGAGPATTILAFDSSAFNGDCIRFLANQDSSRTDRPIGSTTAGGTSVTTTTHSDAANFLAGDIIHISGTDADSQLDVEVNEVLTDGNGTSGVIALKYPIQRVLTSPTIFANRNGKDHSIEDFQVLMSGTPSPDCFALLIGGTTRFKAKNILCRGFDSAPSNPGVATLYMDTHGWDNLIENCAVEGAQNSGIKVNSQVDAKILNNAINYVAISASGNDAGINISGRAVNTLVLGNTVASSESYGIHVEATSGVPCRRTKILGNHVSRAKTSGQSGIHVAANNLEFEIDNNTCEFVVSNYSIEANGSRGVVSGNQIHRSTRGINVGGGTNISISNNNIVATTAEAMVIQASAAKISIVGNTLIDCATYGIYVNATKIHIANNIIDNITGVGLMIDANCSDVVLNGNASRANSANALTVDNAATNILINTNNFRGGTVSLGTSASVFYSNNME